MKGRLACHSGSSSRHINIMKSEKLLEKVDAVFFPKTRTREYKYDPFSFCSAEPEWIKKLLQTPCTLCDSPMI